MKKIKIAKGRFKDEEYRFDGLIDEMGYGTTDLPSIAFLGNWAAINALKIDKYKVDDRPFYYGKIGALGYILSHEDLYGEKK